MSGDANLDDWLHDSGCDKKKAEALLKGDGKPQDGRFLVAEGKKAGTFVLSLYINGKVDHFPITPDSSTGCLAVKKRVLGPATEGIEGLIDLLANNRPDRAEGWDQRLVEGVNPNGILTNVGPPVKKSKKSKPDSTLIGKPSSLTKKAGLDKKKKTDSESSKPNAHKPVNSVKTTKRNISEPGDLPYYHPKVKKAAAEELLDSENAPTGRFLLRPKGPPGEYIISVSNKGKPVHVAVKKNPDGEYEVSGNAIGAKTLTGVIEHVMTKRKYWPAPLIEYVATSDSSVINLTTPAGTVLASRPTAVKLETPRDASKGEAHIAGDPGSEVPDASKNDRRATMVDVQSLNTEKSIANDAANVISENQKSDVRDGGSADNDAISGKDNGPLVISLFRQSLDDTFGFGLEQTYVGQGLGTFKVIAAVYPNICYIAPEGTEPVYLERGDAVLQIFGPTISVDIEPALDVGPASLDDVKTRVRSAGLEIHMLVMRGGPWHPDARLEVRSRLQLERSRLCGRTVWCVCSRCTRSTGTPIPASSIISS